MQKKNGVLFLCYTRTDTADMRKHTNTHTLPLQFATTHHYQRSSDGFACTKTHNEHSLSMALLGVTRRHARYYYQAERCLPNEPTATVRLCVQKRCRSLARPKRQWRIRSLCGRGSAISQSSFRQVSLQPFWYDLARDHRRVRDLLCTETGKVWLVLCFEPTTKLHHRLVCCNKEIGLRLTAAPHHLARTNHCTAKSF